MPVAEEERVEVAVADGVVDGRLTLPEGGGRAPLVVLFHDAGGLRPAMSGMADRLAASGFAVLQPNLYRRSPPFAPFDFRTVWTDPGERARIRALMDGFSPEQAMADTRALVEHVSGRVSADRIGCTGYCMGGRMATFAAAHLADRVVAAASIHGGGLVTAAPNSPHLGFPKVRGRMYFGVAGSDGSCTPEQAGQLVQALLAANVRALVEHEPTARHGYAVPDFPVYDREAAERHWRRLGELFGEALAA